ncbi:MAG: 2-oxoacid:ferredoxin oxidoreductase subunit gamma [Thermoprotei archaeon]|nr:MAG: 2-oxoacid:ferredoxin oxidoreductase subunit gamma [Thermoprotei archaeon]
MARLELRLAGLGGHGIIFMGRILGYAAIYAGKDVAMATSYSPAQRGGWSKADLVISDEPIDYPLVSQLDVLVATTQEMLMSELNNLKPNGILIVDRDLVKVSDEICSKYKVYAASAMRISEEIIGTSRAANMVLLGVLVAVTSIVEPKYVEESIRNTVRRKEMIEPNIKAFNKGYSIYKK